MLKRSAALPKERLKAFEKLYGERMLGAHETVSGSGSMLMNTRGIRAGLEPLLGTMVHSILDVGCGDFNWMSAVDLRGMRYTGIDIVKPLVEENRRRWLEPHLDFKVMDIVEAVPPAHDLALCRDLFTHFPIGHIVEAFNNIKKSGCKYLAVTGYTPVRMIEKIRKESIKKLNANNAPGYWRPVNLQQKPFLLRPPLFSISENQPGKMLDIWLMDDLPLLDLEAGHNPESPEDFAAYEFFQQLCDLPFVKTIYLFGSRARGVHRADSDVDLLVACDAKTTRQQWLKVCDIIDAVDIPLHFDCLRHAPTLASQLRDWPLDYKVTLYERPD